ncbi:indolepyruvate ferredoxin oxidoreductase family protein [Tistrella sp. BH-R2-4]|uniref:Indolepyruvate ferredoxin oxidoreductase family protein n=2 Tax=Geminicoccaceae TaxID=2066434 RepID=A0ABU9YSL4_9PROT
MATSETGTAQTAPGPQNMTSAAAAVTDGAGAPRVSLDDKYTLPSGRIYVTGTQALVRALLLQAEADRAAGLDTGGFVSGYRGSPLGGVDQVLWQAKRHVDKAGIVFNPGVNEDLAATSVWGTQQLKVGGGSSDKDGVFALWYGKGPGVDRSGDAIKHGNLAGTAPMGGVVAVFGDDHTAKSSTVAHQSEPGLIAAHVPILNPATIGELVDYILAGFALSRASGCWVGVKALADTVEGSASIEIDPARHRFRLPDDITPPPGGLHIRWPDPPMDQEARQFRHKLPMVQAWVRANGLDRVTHDAPRRRFGIIAVGKAWGDVLEALDLLGIDAERLAAAGIVIYKPALTWPLEPVNAVRFARGLEEVLVVEEKKAIVEEQLARLLYGLPDADRPRLSGKTDAEGRPLFQQDGALDPLAIARAIAVRFGLDQASTALVTACGGATAGAASTGNEPPVPGRSPWFCSGCPHNSSTKLPEGSRALAGIGCHGMAIYMPTRRTTLWSHMGAEGAAWIGQAPFSKDAHIFQNLGDGTYFHSGLLAIRAAIAAKVNITYKILYNDAVAMTGGQPVDGQLLPWQISQQVTAEGAAQVIVVTDEPDKYPAGTPWARGVTIRDRDELDEVQRELRTMPGVTVLLYDQTCAAEKRRRRKRGTMADPDLRTFINPRVCEGCGDCGTASNCVSVKPLETSFGRKRQIDQSSCNKDFSCVDGFCPSFVTVSGARPAKRPAPTPKVAAGQDQPAPDAGLPQPTIAPPETGRANILVTGIGGTGIVTVGALIGMAAHIEGRAVSVLDQTGLAQKNGAVTSHVRVAPLSAPPPGGRVPPASLDALIAADMVVAAGAEPRATYAAGRTRGVANSHVVPIASFAVQPDMDMGEGVTAMAVEASIGRDALERIDATRIARALFGDSLYANPFLLGMAWQKGLVPVGLDALREAIRLNGQAVAMNLLAFGWGRKAAVDRAAVLRAAGLDQPATATALPMIAGGPDPERAALPDLVDFYAGELTAYQDAGYAARYQAVVARVEAAERTLPGQGGDLRLTRTVARYLYKLMAYKDEYEVARLYTDGSFARALKADLQGGRRITLHLAPPILARPDPVTGRPKKMTFGPWMLGAMRVLAAMKRLRGTAFDPFGRTAERRKERQLIEDYIARIDSLLPRLTPATRDTIRDIAAVPERIRGYGHVKDSNLRTAEIEEKRLLARLDAGPDAARVAAE